MFIIKLYFYSTGFFENYGFVTIIFYKVFLEHSTIFIILQPGVLFFMDMQV